jgi:hypothetical protein
MLHKFLTWYWNRRVRNLYSAYHADFEDHILEAQQRRNLPQSTVECRNRFNRALKKLKVLDPSTPWKPLA